MYKHKKTFGIVFSRDFDGVEPLGHIGKKLPTYLRLLDLCRESGFVPYVLTRKTYQSKGIFSGGWLYKAGRFKLENATIKADVAYDRTAGVKFPPTNDNYCVWVNNISFKKLAWDKWSAYKLLGKYMPKTVFVKDPKELKNKLQELHTNKVVLKPYNGLKGIGVFVGSKDEALSFKFPSKYPIYIAQDFVDSSEGIPGIADGIHDLRIVMVNRKIVWSHVRTPKEGGLTANVAVGGSIKEVEMNLIPGKVKKICHDIDKIIYNKYDNPVYSLDFGIDKTGDPKIYEINDQMGFPLYEMEQRESFLNELVSNFLSKIK